MSINNKNVLTRGAKRLGKSVCSFAKAKNGSMAVNFAILLVPMLTAVGFGIDGSRLLLTKFELRAALDASALAVGNTFTDETTMEGIVNKFAQKNFHMGGAAITDIQMSDVDGEVVVNGTARVELFFGGILGKEYAEVRATTEVQRAGGGLLAALVVDNTGSMWGSNNISALREANLELIRNAFGAKESGGTWSVTAAPEDLRMAIVPYASMVNVGDEFLNVVDPEDVRDLYRTYVDEEEEVTTTEEHCWTNRRGRTRCRDTTTTTTVVADDAPSQLDDDELRSDTDVQLWKGCVFERASGTHDDTEADLSNDSTVWKPFWYPSETDNNYDPKDVATIVPGGVVNSNQYTGPNMGCPTPITPLTNDFDKLNAASMAITAWNRGGTLSDIGFAWGQRVLTPGLPFGQSSEVDPRYGETVWNSSRWRKSIILMTDGNNLVYQLKNNKGSNQNGTNPNDYYSDGKSDMTGYGRLGDSLFNSVYGTSNSGTAETKINKKIADQCESYKGQGIIVYTVVFTSSVDATTKQMYKDCASDPGKHWYAPDSSSLKNAFGKIGADLAKLRITK